MNKLVIRCIVAITVIMSDNGAAGEDLYNHDGEESNCPREHFDNA